MKTIENAETTEALERLLEKSAGSARLALADSVGWAPRRMDAADLFAFWRRVGLVAMTTVGRSGRPHSAPVHATLAGATLRVLVYEDAQRREDLRSNPHVSFATWDGDGAVAILSGRAREVEGSLRPARPSQSGRDRQVVEFEVRLARAHGMNARPGSVTLDTDSRGQSSSRAL